MEQKRLRIATFLRGREVGGDFKKVDNLPSAGDSWKNTARKKVLQIATFMAMRAVFCWML